MKNIHFIAIGGAAMHNLAIALHKKGLNVSGSDDEIFEPSKSRLKNQDLLPSKIGWDVSLINNSLDAIILGMHARIDNPELLKAQELGIPVFSYPEFLFNQTKDKKRVVIAGSHGKTTITSMVLHVLNYYDKKYDYMVGAKLDGFDCMVGLDNNTDIAIFEGDEYLSSPIDRRPKFMHYKPDVALVTGIAWDHINVFPTFENYVSQFNDFVKTISPKGKLIVFEGDDILRDLVNYSSAPVEFYHTPDNEIVNGVTNLITTTNNKIPLKVFGEHNLQNLNGARLILKEIGVSTDEFYLAIQSFGGASKRLELVSETNHSVFYKDFAHSPSKLKATTSALKNQFKDRKLVACMELHTFSSLNKEFLKQYNGAMEMADEAFVYFNPETIKHKKLLNITEDEVLKAFNGSNIEVFTSSEEIKNRLLEKTWNDSNLLMMSSGNFDGIDFNELAKEIYD